MFIFALLCGRLPQNVTKGMVAQPPANGFVRFLPIGQVLQAGQGIVEFDGAVVVSQHIPFQAGQPLGVGKFCQFAQQLDAQPPSAVLWPDVQILQVDNLQKRNTIV